MVKNLPTNAGDKRDAGSNPGSGRSLGGGHGNPLQYSCLENPMGRVAAVSCSPVSISLMSSISWSGVKFCGKERYQASYRIKNDLGVKGIYTSEVGW